MKRDKILEKYGSIKNYRDILAKRKGFEDYNEEHRSYVHNTGRQLPKEVNKKCPAYFGSFTESLMIQTFEDPIKMPYGNKGFDWTCKRGDKIDNKSVCLSLNIPYWEGWIFSIEYNNIADWFILSAWDDRDSLTPLHVWIFHKNDIVRERKFWRRDSFSITNKPNHLKKFESYEASNRFDKLKDICDKTKTS